MQNIALTSSRCVDRPRSCLSGLVCIRSICFSQHFISFIDRVQSRANESAFSPGSDLIFRSRVKGARGLRYVRELEAVEAKRLKREKRRKQVKLLLKSFESQLLVSIFGSFQPGVC